MNYLLPVIKIEIKDKKEHSITFYIELSSKYVGVGLNFALLNENKSGEPHFSFVFLKGYIKVYGIRSKL